MPSVFVSLWNRTGALSPNNREKEHSGSSSQRPSRLFPSWPFWLWHRRWWHHPVACATGGRLAAGDLGRLRTRRSEMCEQNAWRSNPAMGASARLTCIRRISAPHAKHRIARRSPQGPPRSPWGARAPLRAPGKPAGESMTRVRSAGSNIRVPRVILRRLSQDFASQDHAAAAPPISVMNSRRFIRSPRRRGRATSQALRDPTPLPF